MTAPNVGDALPASLHEACELHARDEALRRFDAQTSAQPVASELVFQALGTVP